MLQRLIAALVTLLCVCSASYAQLTTIRLMSHPLGPSGTKAVQDFATAINRALEGSARVELLPSSPAAFDAVKTGEIALAVFPSDLYASLNPGRFALFELPFVMDDLNQAATFQQSAVGEAMLASVAGDGLLGLGYWNVGMARIFGQSIESEKSLPGMVIRTSSSAIIQTTLRAFGMKPIPILSANEWIPAVTKGEINAFYASPSFVLNTPLRDSGSRQMRFLRSGFVPQVLVVVANKRVWSEFSFQIQSALGEQSRIVAERTNAEAIEREASALGALRERGFKPALDGGALQGIRETVAATWNNSDALPKNNLVNVSLVAIDQHRRNPAPPPKSPSRAQPSDLNPPVLFATDRRREPATEPNLQFGRARGNLVYGAAQVRFGGRIVAQGRTEETRIDQIDMFAGDNSFAAELSVRLKATNQTDVLIYVHGYNTTFRSAMEAGAFLASDIKFAGIPVVFSWPSEGVAIDYVADGNQARISRDSFVQLLSVIKAAEGVKNINIVVHSMGGRVVSDAIEWMTAQSTGRQQFLHNVVFAAPDVDTELFRRLVGRFSQASVRATLYASTFDQALICSRLLNEGPRAGLAGDDLVLHENLDTIDVTKAENPSIADRIANSNWLTAQIYYLIVQSCREGHSYVTRNIAVLNDLNSLIVQNTGPERRIRLQERRRDPYRYWEFLPAQP